MALTSTSISSNQKGLFNEVVSFMEEDNGYLEYGLTLRVLSAHLSVSSSHLSEVINTTTGHGFSDFVNRYRIEEAKRLLTNQPNLKIIDIAFRSGFGSKVTFNNAFKKFVGSSPLEFRKREFK